MKSTLLIALALLLGLSAAQSQITITSATFPQADDAFFSSISFLPEGVDLGLPGVDLSWDFSTLVADVENQVLFQAASEGSANAQFPTANLVVIQLGGGENYFRLDNEKVEFLGFFGTDPAGFGLSITAKYNPPALQRVAPLSYLDTYSDLANVALPFATADLPIDIFAGLPISPDSIRFRVAENLSAEVDAYGQLTIPEGPYEVLRVHQTLLRSTRLDAKLPFIGWQDVTDLVPIGEFLGVDTIETYVFWAEDVRQPIAAVSINGEGLISRIEFKGEGAEPPVSTEEQPSLTAQLRMVPNPSAGASSLQVQGLEAGAYTAHVWNLQGMLVHRQTANLPTGTSQLPIAVSFPLPAGIYLVQLRHADSGQLAGQVRWMVSE
jgi:hypothetical protein